ncbi:carboxylating nicotinate-nucleotide diphosphorylase [Diaminobutyricimonas sp. TR449]|uniref:carboxylating nicotinate-nucleotide diphosphorylase n=1 Tax=Diaminobutyricimonas sp. TR449 TaxID=2708076 RepID=UPI00142051D4|nr:carboxylating nicotinate-nucleotide diphosphorylase [Diaminobutyricimonas sp. TR449]
MLTDSRLDAVVSAALDEDAPWGDITSTAVLPAAAQAQATLTAREPGVLAGSEAFSAAMRLTDATITVDFAARDGDRFDAGDELARVTGPARSVLTGERVGLNFVQRMSGIATLTARFVAAVAGTGARIVDTRKTTPGLRMLERHAVRCGGGHNHRYSLSDAVLVKDNHLAVLTAGGRDLTEALREVRKRIGHTTHFEVEVDRIEQIEPVMAAGVDTIMFDNFSVDQLREGVALVAGRALIDASGGVSLDTVAAIAATGVNVISVGALTHSARAIDLGLDIRIDAP